jgi:hypothetical protein
MRLTALDIKNARSMSLSQRAPSSACAAAPALLAVGAFAWPPKSVADLRRLPRRAVASTTGVDCQRLQYDGDDVVDRDAVQSLTRPSRGRNRGVRPAGAHMSHVEQPTINSVLTVAL